MSEHVSALSDATFDEEIGAASEPVLVAFWAGWCAAGRRVAPSRAGMAGGQVGRARTARRSADDRPTGAGRCGVKGAPTWALFKVVEAETAVVGARGRGEFRQEP